MTIDFNEIETLYRISKDPNALPEQSESAKIALGRLEDAIVSEYLALPENKWGGDNSFGGLPAHEIGTPKYPSYAALHYSYVAVLQPRDSQARLIDAPHPTEDKIGTVLKHRAHRLANPPKTPAFAVSGNQTA